MRVALVDPSLFTLPYDVALARGLVAAGQQVTLHGRALTLKDGSTGGFAVEPDFYAVAGLPKVAALPKAVRLAVKGADHFASMLRLRRRFARERPDIIHFQWLPLPALDATLLAGWRAIAPLVLTVHDTDPFNGSPTARLQRVGFAGSLRGCDKLIVHTQQGVDRLAALGIPAARIALLPHGPLADAPPDSAADPMSGSLTFVLFGKMKPYKGADLLVEAFAGLPSSVRSQAKLRIVGQAYMDLAPLRARVDALGLNEQVAIEPRFVDEQEMPDIFPPASVAVFPYREIEASGVLSLAMAHGRPIIASRIGNFAEIITDGVHGRLVPAGDVAALAEAMRTMIEDRASAARAAEAVRALTRTLPGWNEIARRTLAVYAETQVQAARARNLARAAPAQGPVT